MTTRENQVALRVLHPSAIGPEQPITNRSQFRGRPTPVGVFVFGRQRILLVQSAKGDCWRFVQGCFEPEDVTFGTTILREGKEEVGLQKNCLLGYSISLGECLNPIPAERGCDFTHKHLFMFGVPVRNKDWVELNEENSRFEWVASYARLTALIGSQPGHRSVKYNAMLDAVDRLHANRLLEWSCLGHENH